MTSLRKDAAAGTFALQFSLRIVFVTNLDLHQPPLISRVNPQADLSLWHSGPRSPPDCVTDQT